MQSDCHWMNIGGNVPKLVYAQLLKLTQTTDLDGGEINRDGYIHFDLYYNNDNFERAGHVCEMYGLDYDYEFVPDEDNLGYRYSYRHGQGRWDAYFHQDLPMIYTQRLRDYLWRAKGDYQKLEQMLLHDCEGPPKLAPATIAG
jgi:hypothetical protein